VRYGLCFFLRTRFYWERTPEQLKGEGQQRPPDRSGPLGMGKELGEDMGEDVDQMMDEAMEEERASKSEEGPED
jgi:hypothetical protein